MASLRVASDVQALNAPHLEPPVRFASASRLRVARHRQPLRKSMQVVLALDFSSMSAL
jgi:hypothetical protein